MPAVLFDRPTDIDWLPDGTFFISDGYGGTRVAKFDKDGKFIKDWGGPPKDPKNPGPNEFNTVHSIQISKDRRLFVVDRGHRRIQVFDENGKFLDMWSTGMRSQPYAHIITTDQALWISDGGTNRIVKYDLNGKYLYGWGAPGGLGAVRRTAFHHRRSGRQPVSRGSLQRPGAEVPAKAGRRHGKDGRTGTPLYQVGNRPLNAGDHLSGPTGELSAPRVL